MRIGGKSKAAVLFAGMMISTIVFGTVTTVGDDGDTLISIDPVSKTVSPGETFTVNVSCVPGQPIKSFEFKLSFNASLLQVNSVSEGDIFDGYTTFFNDGTVNNTAGTIVDVYDLIVGAGTVSGSGTLVTLSFTAGLTAGVSYLTLTDVGVTNATEYLPVIVSDGNVSIEVYTLTVNTVGSGSVSKNPNQATYEYNDIVTLTASADAGWTFSSWGGDLSGNQNPKTITMTSNKVVTATFTQNSYTLTVTTVGSGSVTKNPNQATYVYNDVVTLTASASAGWTFQGWSGNLSGSQNPKTITMTSNKVVTATFTQNSYTLTVNIVGVGSVTKNPNQATYAYNDVVTLTASANAGWAFSSWSGDLSGSQNPKTITIDGNEVVTATFVDSAAPTVNNVAVATSTQLDTDPLFGWENISCTVTDNVGVQTVRLLLTCPNASVLNLSMTNKVGTSTYYYRTTLSVYGNYSYRVWARDATGNKQTSGSSLLSMPPNWDVNNDGNQNLLDLVAVSNLYGQNGSLGWTREDVDNNGVIQVFDLVLVSNHYGQSWWN